MNVETEGIILRQTKTLGGRTMITMFSERYGKIGAGTSISEKGRSRSALALRPFCHGRYQLYKNRESYSVTGAEAIDSFYSIGEDVDKYLSASYVLELTDAMLGEDVPQPVIYRLLKEFLSMMEKRKSAYDTLVIAYQIKALDVLGSGPQLRSCMRCGRELLPPYGDEELRISVEEGGLVCADCATERDKLDPLIFDADADIIQILSYIREHSLSSLSELAVPEGSARRIRRILGAYISHHLGISNLKSEGFKI